MCNQLNVLSLYTYRITIKTNTMKEILSLIAMKIAESNLSTDSILLCGGILKKSLILEGFSDSEANVMAIDGIKIVLKAMSKVKF